MKTKKHRKQFPEQEFPDFMYGRQKVHGGMLGACSVTLAIPRLTSWTVIPFRRLSGDQKSKYEIIQFVPLKGIRKALRQIRCPGSVYYSVGKNFLENQRSILSRTIHYAQDLMASAADLAVEDKRKWSGDQVIAFATCDVVIGRMEKILTFIDDALHEAAPQPSVQKQHADHPSLT